MKVIQTSKGNACETDSNIEPVDVVATLRKSRAAFLGCGRNVGRPGRE